MNSILIINSDNNDNNDDSNNDNEENNNQTNNNKVICKYKLPKCVIDLINILIPLSCAVTILFIIVYYVIHVRKNLTTAH